MKIKAALLSIAITLASTSTVLATECHEAVSDYNVGVKFAPSINNAAKEAMLIGGLKYEVENSCSNPEDVAAVELSPADIKTSLTKLRLVSWVQSQMYGKTVTIEVSEDGTHKELVGGHTMDEIRQAIVYTLRYSDHVEETYGSRGIVKDIFGIHQ